MTTASANLFPKVIMEEVANDGSATVTPAADHRAIFLGEDGYLHAKDSAGAVSDPYPDSSVPPGYEYDYVEITSNAMITATSEATADTAITGSAVAYDGSTVVLIEFYSPSSRPDSTDVGRSLGVYLYDGASSIGMLGYRVTQAANAANAPLYLARRLTPSAATHTYSIRADVSAGTGAIGAGAGGSGASMPAFIRITKV